MAAKTVEVNRAPVLTLWAAVVAERLGSDREASLTIGRALAGMNAQTKGRRLGIYHEKEVDEARSSTPGASRAEARRAAQVKFVDLMGREVPTMRTREGIRAAVDGKPIDPESVERYLVKKFGDHLDDVRVELEALARSHSPEELAQEAFALYEKFRPAVPRGEKGWGAKGALDLEVIRKLAKRKAP
jgi:hypothetical protein